MDDYPHAELTRKVIGCAMEVHKRLGNGFQEVIYQRALAIEMAAQGLSFARELEMEIFYRGESIGTRRVDFLVEGMAMVELKALICRRWEVPLPRRTRMETRCSARILSTRCSTVSGPIGPSPMALR